MLTEKTLTSSLHSLAPAPDISCIALTLVPITLSKARSYTKCVRLCLDPLVLTAYC